MLTYPLLFTTSKGNIAQVFHRGEGDFFFEVTTKKGESSSFSFTQAAGAKPGRKSGKLNTDEQDVLATWLSLNH